MGNLRATLMVCVAVVTAGCSMVAGGWPDREGKTPEQMLMDVVRWQQLANVRESTGTLAHECFTDDDLVQFRRRGVPGAVAARLRAAGDFREVVKALAALPPVERDSAYAGARMPARPTWRQMGFVDRAGRGQTEAGQAAERMIADAIVMVFADAVRAADAAGDAR
jgi:hypothetical protein